MKVSHQLDELNWSSAEQALFSIIMTAAVHATTALLAGSLGRPDGQECQNHHITLAA
jgi:hypothetical protein